MLCLASVQLAQWWLYGAAEAEGAELLAYQAAP
jgi:hypothetical protein